MSNEEIKQIYDSNFNLTLSELARITGKTKAELKRILLS